MDFYNHSLKLFANKEVELSALKVMLYSTSYTFDAAETVMSTVSAQQVSGNGWPAGGPTITGAAVTVDATNGAKLDGTDITVTAAGGAIGPAKGLVVYDATGADAAAWKPLFHFDFPSSQTAGTGTDFKVTWHASGIATWAPVP